MSAISIDRRRSADTFRLTLKVIATFGTPVLLAAVARFLNFALFKLHDQLGDRAAAWAALQEGNSVLGPPSMPNDPVGDTVRPRVDMIGDSVPNIRQQYCSKARKY